MLLMVNFFVGFCVDSSNDSLIRHNHQIKSCLSICCRARILGILFIFWIIKCVDLELIFFAINLDVSPTFKVFNTFDYMFISIVLLT